MNRIKDNSLGFFSLISGSNIYKYTIKATRASTLPFMIFSPIKPPVSVYCEHTKLIFCSNLSSFIQKNFMLFSRILFYHPWYVLTSFLVLLCFCRPKAFSKIRTILQFKRQLLSISLHTWKPCEKEYKNNLPKIIYLLIIKLLKIQF